MAKTPMFDLRPLTSSDGGQSDEELLRSVVQYRDSSAFEQILRRHGPFLLASCRRLIGHHHDAEDAFQAVFLLLARNASTIRNPHALPAWLFGVAVRVSLKVRRRNRARAHRAIPDHQEYIDRFRFDESSDILPIVEEELGRLPEHDRDAIFQSDVLGLSRREASRQLNIAEGTLSSRLAKGRKRLAENLTRRGVTLSVSRARPKHEALRPRPNSHRRGKEHRGCSCWRDCQTWSSPFPTNSKFSHITAGEFLNLFEVEIGGVKKISFAIEDCC